MKHRRRATTPSTTSNNDSNRKLLITLFGIVGFSFSPSAVLCFHRISYYHYGNNDPLINVRRRLAINTNSNTVLAAYFSYCCRTTSTRYVLNKKKRDKRETAARGLCCSSTTALSMVLTTPENIIEEAVTANQSLLDDLIDECVLFTARRPIILQFRPNPVWTWTQWRGTTFSETWTLVLQHICWATLVTVFLLPTATTTPPILIKHLQGLDELFTQLLSVTTFTLTFFLDQSYNLWRKCLDLSRQLQGRLNDVGFMLAAHAARTTTTSNFSSNAASHSQDTSYSQYTKPARQTLELIARYIRLLNILTYASFTLSHRPILTPRGMRRLVERHIITPREREILVSATKLPATQKHNMVLLWMTRAVIEAREAGHITGGSGFEEQFLEKIDSIRANYGAIGGELQARMPFGAFFKFIFVFFAASLAVYVSALNQCAFLFELGSTQHSYYKKHMLTSFKWW
jgi:hypothetical protein